MNNEGSNQRKNGSFTLYEEELYREDERDKEPVQQLIVFGLGDEYYGVDIQDVSEVVVPPPITPLPNVPAHIAGVFSLRGNIIPVTDLKAFLGLSEGEQEKIFHIVVIKHGDYKTGLFTEASAGIAEIPISEMAPPVATLDQGKGELIKGQVKWNDKLIAVLNAGNVIEKTRIQ